MLYSFRYNTMKLAECNRRNCSNFIMIIIYQWRTSHHYRNRDDKCCHYYHHHRCRRHHLRHHHHHLHLTYVPHALDDNLIQSHGGLEDLDLVTPLSGWLRDEEHVGEEEAVHIRLMIHEIMPTLIIIILKPVIIIIIIKIIITFIILIQQFLFSFVRKLFKVKRGLSEEICRRNRKGTIERCNWGCCRA